MSDLLKTICVKFQEEEYIVYNTVYEDNSGWLYFMVVGEYKSISAKDCKIITKLSDTQKIDRIKNIIQEVDSQGCPERQAYWKIKSLIINTNG